MTKNPFQFNSVFASQLIKMIDEKKACGQTSINWYFGALDRFFIENQVKKPILSQRIVNLWCKRRECEPLNTLACRISAVRLFADFLIRQGKTAYYFPKFSAPKIFDNSIPYIYSHEEIAALFNAADELKRTRADWHLSYFPVIIRLFYSTGLRRGEANKLLWRDIDLKKWSTDHPTGKVSERSFCSAFRANDKNFEKIRTVA